MPNVSDADEIIQRISELLQITYQQAQSLVLKGQVAFSIPSSSTSLPQFSWPQGKIPSGFTRVQKFIRQTCTADTQYVVHTVTSGKKLYVTAVIVDSEGNASSLKFGDNVVATVRPASTTVENNSCVTQLGAFVMSFTFPTPLECSTNFSFTLANSAQTIDVGFVGWEEDV